jgi:hypothetical protein
MGRTLQLTDMSTYTQHNYIIPPDLKSNLKFYTFHNQDLSQSERIY